MCSASAPARRGRTWWGRASWLVKLAQIFRFLQPVVGLQIFQMRPVEWSPQHRGGFDAGGAAALHVVAGKADENRLPPRGAELFDSLEKPLGVRRGGGGGGAAPEEGGSPRQA